MEGIAGVNRSKMERPSRRNIYCFKMNTANNAQIDNPLRPIRLRRYHGIKSRHPAINAPFLRLLRAHCGCGYPPPGAYARAMHALCTCMHAPSIFRSSGEASRPCDTRH